MCIFKSFDIQAAKKIKSSAAESMSEEDSLEDPSQMYSHAPLSPSASFCSSDKANASFNSESFHDDASKVCFCLYE